MAAPSVSNDPDRAGYQLAVVRLVERTRQMRVPWSPTPLRNEITRIARRVEELANLLNEAGCAQFDIEAHHDARGLPDPTIGDDGMRIEQDDSDGLPSYARIKSDLCCLAESARLTAESLRDPRERPALGFAALGYLFLRSWYGFPRPTLSNSSGDVDEFGRIWADICETRSVPLSPERLRGALSDAFKKFDPYLWPPGIEELF